ncbi:MAG: hypothetical protein IPM21_01980 [Acidobacteria bacterium]|nr:hypothetical protein [Acidobacteriota bacterium]
MLSVKPRTSAREHNEYLQVSSTFAENLYFYCVYGDLKEGEPGFSAGLIKEGQLKERSEGYQAQWQTALGEVMAAGS